MPSLTLEEALAGRDKPRSSSTAMRPMNEFLAELLDLPEKGSVYTVRATVDGSIQTRMQTKGALGATVLAVVHPDDFLEEETHRLAPAILRSTGASALVRMVVPLETREVDSWTVFESQNGTVAERLGETYEVERVVVRTGPEASDDERTIDFDDLVVPVPVVASPLVLDPRLRRMLRLAIASSRAVMLVGPPGTGKTTLLAEAVQHARSSPASYGLTAAPDAEPLQVTPEEGWTTRELVGGETVDDRGRLRFRKGYVLDAIAEDRWLVLDEANRADMDRIFGGLLTFLSGKPVTVGRTAGHPGAPSVVLDWNDEPTRNVENEEALESGEGAHPVRFRAGTDWRILGTYNALDAHRVFRFGQALGRRFARVPVPAITVDEFGSALKPFLDALEERLDAAGRDRVSEVLTGLYAAHLDTPPVIGPAIFLSVPAYVARGLDHPGDDGGVDLEELLVEGYMLGAGPLLAQLDPNDLDAFGARVVGEGLIGEDQWQFLRDLLPTLA